MGSRFNHLALLAFAGGAVLLTGAPATVSAAPPAAASSAMIPPAEFVKKVNMRNPRIAPDGKHFAYVTGAGGKEVLVVMDLTAPTKPPVTVMSAAEAREAGERTMTEFRWVGSENIVITIISREDLGRGPGDFRRLVAYNLASGKFVPQAWRGSGGDAAEIRYIDHTKGEYLVERDAVSQDTEAWGLPEVVRVNVATGDYTMVQRTNPIVTGGWAADSDGVVRAGLASDGENGKTRILYRSNDKQPFHTVFNQADKSFTENIPIPQLFIPGTDQAYVISRSDGFGKVYKMDLTTLKLSAPVFETPGFDVQDVLTDFTDRAVLGYRVFDGSEHARYTDPTFAEIQGFLDETFGKGEADIVDTDAKQNLLVVRAGGTSKGSGYFLYDVDQAKISLLNWTRVAIKDTPLNPVHAEWITASDGTKLQVIVTMPRHRTGKNLPVVIMPHGGPFGIFSATNALEPWNQPLAEAGYVVIQPNYRGSGGYGKAFEKMGRDPGGYGKRMQDDLTDVLNAFAAKGAVDPKRACIMGWSYGGYAAARGAQRDGGLWRCAIAGAGIYDMAMMNRWDAEHLGKFNSGFQATSDDPDGISAAQHTDGKWAPLLVVAGERDQRIPMEQSRTLVANLKRSGKVENTDFRYIVQPQGTHNLPYDDVHVQWITEALSWLNRFDPAYTAGDSDKPPS